MVGSTSTPGPVVGGALHRGEHLAVAQQRRRPVGGLVEPLVARGVAARPATRWWCWRRPPSLPKNTWRWLAPGWPGYTIGSSSAAWLNSHSTRNCGIAPCGPATGRSGWPSDVSSVWTWSWSCDVTMLRGGGRRRVAAAAATRGEEHATVAASARRRMRLDQDGLGGHGDRADVDVERHVGGRVRRRRVGVGHVLLRLQVGQRRRLPVHRRRVRSRRRPATGRCRTRRPSSRPHPCRRTGRASAGCWGRVVVERCCR